MDNIFFEHLIQIPQSASVTLIVKLVDTEERSSYRLMQTKNINFGICNVEKFTFSARDLNATPMR